MAKMYYWLRLKTDFFKSKEMKKLRKIAGGDTYTIIYLKLQLLSLTDDGFLYFDGIEDSFAEELALMIDEEPENVQATLLFLQKCGLLELKSEHEMLLSEVPSLIGKETDKAALMRRKRERDKENIPKLEAKSNAERQKAFRAKQFCEKKEHVPLIEDHMNRTRYNGNYYLVLKRDGCKCRMCGSTENLCVHHIDGYDENKPQNSNINKMITLCRSCHIKVHRRDGYDISEDLLESIDYYDSNVTDSVTAALPQRYTDIDIEREKESKSKNNNNSVQNASASRAIEESFARFWSAYPKKQGKQDAFKAFKKASAKVNEEVMLESLEAWKASEQWKKEKGKYIPMASTWLNGERWNDELEISNMETYSGQANHYDMYREMDTWREL